MKEREQIGLIKEFMVALAPEVARHRFSLIRHHHLSLSVNEELTASYTEIANENARITLELSMHLAAKYADCYDSLTRHEAKSPPPPKSNPGTAVPPVCEASEESPY
jgi:hypothetical protein